MKIELTLGEAELGPAVLCDRAHVARLEPTDQELDLVQASIERASDEGLSCWLRADGMISVGGRFEVVVDEQVTPAAEITGSARGLRLSVPTGQLVFQSAARLLKREPSTAPVEITVPPGEYRADLFAYESPELKVERSLPRRSVLSIVFTAMALVFLLVTAALAFSIVVLAGDGEWAAIRWPVGLIAAMWGTWWGLYWLTGQHRRDRRSGRAYAAAVRRLPREPDYRIVLTRTDAVVGAKGGGLTA